MLPKIENASNIVKALAERHNVPIEKIEEQLQKGIDVEKEHTDDEGIALKIALDHVAEIPDYYDRLAKMEGQVDLKNESKKLENAINLPKLYYFKHIKAGLVGYDNETLLVTNEALKNMCKTFEGKPVVVYHQDINQDFINKLQEKADGYVVDCFYNENDGCWWGKMIVVSDNAHSKVRMGWSVSNAYVPTSFGNGGHEHNLPYDRELLTGYFTHLAIVPNPRYEDACIMSPEAYKEYNEQKKRELEELKNSKTEKRGKLMFKLFQRKEVKEVADLENSLAVTDAGIEVNLKEAVDFFVLNDCGKKKVNMDEEIEVGEEKMPIKELVNRYMKTNKKNAEEEEEKKKKEEEEKRQAAEAEEKKKKEEEEKRQADEEEKKKKEEKEKEEAKNNEKGFKELVNAGNKEEEKIVVETNEARLARGRKNYGS